MRPYKYQHGMTLLELLIATAVLSIMAGMGFVGINVLMEASVRIEEKQRLLQQQNRQLILLSQDVSAAISSKQSQNTTQNIDFTGDGLRFELVRFEQSLLPEMDQNNQELGDVIQVAWFYRNGTLYRAQRPEVQKNNSQTWQEQAMMEINSWHCQYLSISGQWQPNWPSQTSENVQLPRQVKCRVTSTDDRVSEWFLTPWQET